MKTWGLSEISVPAAGEAVKRILPREEQERSTTPACRWGCGNPQIKKGLPSLLLYNTREDSA